MKTRLLQMMFVSMAFVACGNDEKATEKHTDAAVEMSKENQAKVLELEKTAKALEQGAKDLEAKADAVSSEVDDLLKDI